MSTSLSTDEELIFSLHDRPGLSWTPARCHEIRSELRKVASHCLSPLPSYQCLSSSPHAFDDKLLIIARSRTTNEIVAFVSAVYLPVPDIPLLLHTGLTCILPEYRRSGLTIMLFHHVFVHMVSQHPGGFWLSSLAEVPSSLVSINTYATNVFPSPPPGKRPSDTHLHIARTVSEKHRDAMLITPTAIFEEDAFVFRGSNPVGSPFRKDVDDPVYHHRRTATNEYYRSLFRRNMGDEAFQVGFVDPNRIMEAMGEERFEKRAQVRVNVLGPGIVMV
jgi:hypothetical protein